jgi:hypothetical protein
LSDDVDRRAGSGAGQGRAFLVRDGQMDGSQEPADLSAPAVIGAGGLTEGSLQVRPRRSLSDILRRIALAEDEEEEDDESDAKEPEGAASLSSRGLRGGDADLARRDRGDRPSTPPSSTCSPCSVSWRIGERQPTRMRPETKSSSAELMVVPAPEPLTPRWREANSKSPADVQKSASVAGA